MRGIEGRVAVVEHQGVCFNVTLGVMIPRTLFNVGKTGSD